MKSIGPAPSDIACPRSRLASSSWLPPCPWQYISRDLCMYSNQDHVPGWGFGALLVPRFPQQRPRTVLYCCQVASSFVYSLHGNSELNVKPVRQRPLIRYGHMVPHTTLVYQQVNVSTEINLRSVQCTSLPQSLLTELLFLCNQLFNF